MNDLDAIKEIFDFQVKQGNLTIRLNIPMFKWLIERAEKADELERINELKGNQ